MNTEALLKRHFEAVATQVEIADTPVEEIVGRVRNARMWLGLGAIAATLLAVVAVAGLMSRGSNDLVGPQPTVTDGTALEQVVATLPETFNPGTAIAVYAGNGSAEDVAIAYLLDRLGLESRVMFVEVVGPGFEAVRVEPGEVGHLGWVLIRRGEGDLIEVIASSTDGVDLSEVTLRDGQISVRVEASGVGILSLDVLELSGDPIAGAVNPAGVPRTGGPRSGTAGVVDASQPDGAAVIEFSAAGVTAPVIIRANDVGGRLLTVSEFIIEPEPGSAEPEVTVPPDVSDPETTSITTTTIPEEAVIAWSAADAERDVENYLAALAAGAYEQAAWSLENNGGAFDEQDSNETPAQYLERACAGRVCSGPYTVTAEGPGVVNEFGQASSTVTVAAVGSGDTAQFSVFTFEGQRIVSGVPPAATDGEPGLVARLFGENVPERVVVQRFDAFEIWEGGTSGWVTNWWADDVRAIEQRFAVGWNSPVVDLLDSGEILDPTCGTLMTRGQSVLALDQCQEGGWTYIDLTTGDAVDPPIAYVPAQDGEYIWFAERGNTTLIGEGDAEGNLVALTADDVDLAGDDYISSARLSVDGSMVAYVDHRDPNAYNHFYSPVVVVKDVATGAEINRWVLDGPVLSLEFAGEWVVAWEGSGAEADLASGPSQVAAVAINVRTGEINRVETGTRVFLPS